MSETWRAIPLGAVAEWSSGGTPSKSREEFWNGEIPWISGSSMQSERLSDSDRKVTALAIGKGTRIAPTDSTLVLVRGMSLLDEIRVGRAVRPVAFNQDVKALVPDTSIVEPQFLTYALLADAPALLAMVHRAGHGTGVLDTEQLKSHEIRVPPLEAQRAIVDVLSAFDDLAETDLSLAGQCEDLALGSVRTLPLATTLGDVLDLVTCSTRPHGTVDHFSLPAFDAGRLPIREPGSGIKSNKILLGEPSLLVSRLNPHIPRVWMAYPEASAAAMASTEFAVFQGSGVEFYWAACALPQFGQTMCSMATGTTGSHQRVDKEALSRIPVPALSSTDSRSASVVTSLVRHAYACRVEAAELIRARDELLPLLISGRVHPAAIA